MDSTISAKLGLSHPAVDAQKSSTSGESRSPDLFEHFMQVSRGAASAKLTERSKDVARDAPQAPNLERIREEDDVEREDAIGRAESKEDDDQTSTDFVGADSSDESIAELENAFGEEIVLQPSIAITQAITDTNPLVETEGDSADGQTIETLVTLPGAGTEGIQAGTSVVQTTEQAQDLPAAQAAILPGEQQLDVEAASKPSELQAAPVETSQQTNQEEPGPQQGQETAEYLPKTGEIDSNKPVEAPTEKLTAESTTPNTSHGEASDSTGEQKQPSSQSDDSKWYQEENTTPAPFEASETGESAQPRPQDALATEEVLGQSSAFAQDGASTGDRPLEADASQQDAAQPTGSVSTGNSVTTTEVAATATAAATARSADAVVQTSTQTSGSTGLGSAPPASSAGRAEGTATSANANQASPTNEPDSITQHERIRLIQRVSRSFSRLTPTGGEITLRLHPPQLGSLAVKVQMEGNTLSARLSTESQAAREIIVENLPILRKRLAEQGIEVTQMHVDVSDGSSDAQQSNSGNFGAGDSGYGDRAAQERTAQYRRAMSGREPNEANTQAAAGGANVSPTTQPWVAASSIDVHA